MNTRMIGEMMAAIQPMATFEPVDEVAGLALTAPSPGSCSSEAGWFKSLMVLLLPHYYHRNPRTVNIVGVLLKGDIPDSLDQTRRQ
jgi:hypothetical protein